MSRAAGAVAERRAADHLQQLGYRIVARNWTCRGGELDLVCEHRGTMVFVEVRARKDARHGAAVETVSATKQRRLVHAAEQYLLAHALHERACRFDVIAIEGDHVEHYIDVISGG
jgi:putative endonuclease